MLPRAVGRGRVARGAGRAARRPRRSRAVALGRQAGAPQPEQDAAQRQQEAPPREQGAPRPDRYPLGRAARVSQALRPRVTAADEQHLRAWAAASASRMEFWPRFVNETGATVLAEIGVYRGDFAARLLAECADMSTYYMIDPWRHLADWNKPANKADDVFERYFRESMRKTSAWADKRVVLRGKTTDVIHQVSDGALDFAYVDGDHTLRGITIDLVTVFPKVRAGGWVGGDDFSPSIWQHSEAYEPTLVCPFAIYFAEAVGARIYALPYKQFLIEKTGAGYELVDLTGRYGALDLRSQFIRQGVGQSGRVRLLAGRVRRRLRRWRLRS